MDLLGISRVLPINRIVGSNIVALEILLEIVVVCSLQDGCVSKLGNHPIFKKEIVAFDKKQSYGFSIQTTSEIWRWQACYPGR